MSWWEDGCDQWNETGCRIIGTSVVLRPKKGVTRLRNGVFQLSPLFIPTQFLSSPLAKFSNSLLSVHFHSVSQFSPSQVFQLFPLCSFPLSLSVLPLASHSLLQPKDNRRIYESTRCQYSNHRIPFPHPDKVCHFCPP